MARRTAARGAPFDGDVQVGDVVQDKVREDLVAFLADEFDEGLRGQLLPELVRRQPVLRECVVELFEDCRCVASASNFGQY